MYKIILASESPRRREIMDTMGILYEAKPANVIEEVEETEPDRMVQALAEKKAKHIAEQMGISTQSLKTSERKGQEANLNYIDAQQDHTKQDHTKQDHTQDLLIIGADTMVFSHGQALGKPKDKDDAVRMLKLLSDDFHEVYTGVAIIIRKGDEVQLVSFAVSTKVFVHSLTIEQIEDYIATGEPMDKAGAYAIQGRFGIFIKSIEGDYYNIVGLPIAQIYAKLLNSGIDLKKL